MMRSKYAIICALIVLLSGCYQDEGNYDYQEINDISVSFTPTSGEYNAEQFTYSYVYRQPASDTLKVTYKPEVLQSMTKGSDNLLYEWIVTKNKMKPDTVRTKELTLKFAPKTRTTYNVRFRLTDNQTGISLYRTLRIMTEVPFVKSWLVLHGETGSVKLGSVEYPDKGNKAEILTDAYGTIHGTANPFSNVNNMFYNAADGSEHLTQEHVTLLEPGKAFYMHPFDMSISKRGYNLMVPDPAQGLRLSYGVTNNAQGRYSAIVTEDGKFIHGGPNGFYHPTNTQPETADYHVDKAYLSPGGYLTIWDNRKKEFMYYNFGDNWYTWYNGDGRPTGVMNNAELTPYPQEIFSQNEMKDREVTWIGPSLDPSEESGCMAIVKDINTDNYWAYMYKFGSSDDKDGEGGGGGTISVSRRALSGMNLDADSHFASSVAFADQFFYSKGGSLYHYNIVTGKNSEIYSVAPGAKISGLQFRASYYHYAIDNENRKLAVIVLSPDGKKGELHEITFNQSGDVIDVVVFDGNFGPIKNIEYTFIHRFIIG